MRLLLAIALTLAALTPANAQLFGGSPIVHDPVTMAAEVAKMEAQIQQATQLVTQSASMLQNLRSITSPSAFASTITQSAGLISQARGMLTANQTCPVPSGAPAPSGGPIVEHTATGVWVSAGEPSPAPVAAAANPCTVAASVANRQLAAMSNLLSSFAGITSLNAGGVAGPTAALQMLTAAQQQATAIEAALLQLRQAEVIQQQAQQASEKQVELKEFLAPASL